LLEVSVATALLAVLLGTTTQFLRVLAGQQRAGERRLVAMQAVQAMAEQIGNMRGEELTAGAAPPLAIPAEAKRYLPGARLEIDVADEPAPAAKRVSIALSWNGPGGQRAGKCGLTTWVFPEASGSDDPGERTDE
jgi:hypothetical protein